MSEKLYIYKLERDRERDSEYVDPALNSVAPDDASSFYSRPGVVTMSFDRALKLSQVRPAATHPSHTPSRGRPRYRSPEAQGLPQSAPFNAHRRRDHGRTTAVLAAGGRALVRRLVLA